MWAGRGAENAAVSLERRVQKRGADVLEPRVAVGAVDDRVVLRVERKWVTTDVDREIRRVSLAIDVDPLERTAEGSMRRELAGDAMEDVEVGPRERKRTFERRVPRLM